MRKILQLIKNFEKRNNISISITIFGDGSAHVDEFWDEERLCSAECEGDLIQFLMNTQYRLDEDGRCFSPVELNH